MSDFRYLIKRHNTWYPRVAVPPSLIAVAGKQHVVRTLGTRDVAEARFRRWTVIAEIHNHFATLRGLSPGCRKALNSVQDLPKCSQGANATSKDIPLKALMGSWEREAKPNIKAQTVDQHLAAISEFMKSAEVHVMYCPQVTRRIAGDFVTNVLLRDSDLAPKTVNRKISSLSSFWKWLIRRGHAASNPWSLQADHTKATKHRLTKERPYSPEELVKLLQGYASHSRGPYGEALKDLIPLALLTGCRLNELCELKPEHINPTSKTITIAEGKTASATREVPVHPLVWPMVYARSQGGPWVFPGLASGGPDGKRSWNVSKRFTAYRRKVLGRESDGFLDFHSLRRSFMTYMERGKLHAPNTITDSLIAELVGHVKPTMAGAVYSGGFHPGQRRAAIDHLSALIEPEVLQAIAATQGHRHNIRCLPS